jgi:DNA repair protein RadD
VIEKEEREAAEKRLHDAEASRRAILGSEPETLEVSDVELHRHRKPDSPDSIRVEYRCGLSVFREWICLDHEGFAQRKARRWWFERFGEEAKTITVDDALADMFLAARLRAVTKTITVIQRGKYSEITGYELEKGVTSK